MHRPAGSEKFCRYLAGIPGGTMFDYGSHLIDFIVDLLGEPLEVAAFKTALSPQPIDDNCTAVLRFARAQATVHCAMGAPAAMANRRFTVRGTNGILKMMPFEQGYDPVIGHPLCNQTPVLLRLVLADKRGNYEAGERFVSAGLMHDRYEHQLREFAAMLRGEMRSSYSAEHEIAVQKAVLAASGLLKI